MLTPAYHCGEKKRSWKIQLFYRQNLQFKSRGYMTNLIMKVMPKTLLEPRASISGASIVSEFHRRELQWEVGFFPVGPPTACCYCKWAPSNQMGCLVSPKIQQIFFQIQPIQPKFKKFLKFNQFNQIQPIQPIHCIHLSVTTMNLSNCLKFFQFHDIFYCFK